MSIDRSGNRAIVAFVALVAFLMIVAAIGYLTGRWDIQP